MTNVTEAFTDRASWLAYRADWRIRYAAASQEVRDAKKDLRAEYAAGGDGSGGQGWLHRQRRAANRLMVELDAAKERKAELLAAKDETPAAKAA